MKYQFDEFMQEEHAEFLEEFMHPFILDKPEESELKQYEGVLPNNLLAYWAKYGFCGYHRGLFWTVNPKDYVDILKVILKESEFEPEDCFVIGRDAFGRLYIWNRYFGEELFYSPLTAQVVDTCSGEKLSIENLNKSAATFFSSSDVDDYDTKDMHGELLFDKAFEKLGLLKPNEIYAFAPAMVLGGPKKLENLHKVDLITHIEMLLDLQKPEVVLLRD